MPVTAGKTMMNRFDRGKSTEGEFRAQTRNASSSLSNYKEQHSGAITIKANLINSERDSFPGRFRNRKTQQVVGKVNRGSDTSLPDLK